MNIVSSQYMGEIDQKAQTDYKIPAIVLMENAGIKLYNSLYHDIWKGVVPEKTVFIAGKGNNGGDAFVMARQHYLSGYKTKIIIPDNTFKEGLSYTHLTICRSLGIELISLKEEHDKALFLIDNSDWIIEGLSGTGLKGELKNSPAEIAVYINKSPAKICSIDIPSGIGDMYEEGFCAVSADITLTVGLPKFSLYTPSGRKKCGRIITVPIGFPQQLINDSQIKDCLLTFKDLKELINPPSPYIYKNRNGHTAVFAGSPGMTGAAKMCASASLNSLSGLVTVKVTDDIYDNFSDISPSLLTEIENYSSFDESSLDKYSCAVMGPGWGKSLNKKNWLKAFLSRTDTPCVIDADGLNLLSELIKNGFKIKNSKCIITPHIGEFSRLTGFSTLDIQNNPEQMIKDFSQKHNITVVLKSHVIWISAPDKTLTIIDGCNPAMATAGSGDILAGIISGLLSYGLNTVNAARAGVLIHQLSGKLCYNDIGFFKSEFLLNYIGRSLKTIFQDKIT